MRFLLLDLKFNRYYKHGGNGFTTKKHEAKRYEFMEALQIVQGLNIYAPQAAMVPASTIDFKRFNYEVVKNESEAEAQKAG